MSARRDGKDETRVEARTAVSSEEERLHARAVDAWMADTGVARLPPPARQALFDAALAAVWARAKVTLGPVTLAAIAERVAHAASRKAPLLAAVAVDESGFELALLADAAKEEPDGAALTALRTLLLELLVVLGRLTAEILTPALHAEIARVRPEHRSPERR